MTTPTGLIFDLKRYALHDGPGIRTTVFFKGCRLRCTWCHNPESQLPQRELMWRAGRCIQCAACAKACPQNAINLNGTGATLDRSLCDLCGACAQVCYSGAWELSGRQMTVAEVMAEVERDVPFYDQSGGGVTFSGGEPLLQPGFLLDLLRTCRARDIHTAVDTSGYAPWKVLDNVRQYVDLFLYDLKLMDAARHRQYTGVSNALILSNLQALSELGHTIIVRIPLIPGINDGKADIQAAGRFLASLPQRHPVGLLPYHEIAAAKYAGLGVEAPLTGIRPPTETQMQVYAASLRGYGLQVKN